MTKTPPDWVLIEAAKRAGFHLTPAQFQAGLIAKAARPYLLALCDMILKHEQQPVDRKLLCAREAFAQRDGNEAYQYRNGDRDTYPCVEGAVRAIHLYEEGFGK